MAFKAISNPELLCSTDNRDVGTVSDKDTGFACSDKDCAVFALIDVDTCSSIE